MGIKKGKTYPNEFIMLMAHWDHLGKDSSLDGDQIYNGAVDNATGTALIMSVAERLKNEDLEFSKSLDNIKNQILYNKNNEV